MEDFVVINSNFIVCPCSLFSFFIQGDQKVSVQLMISVQKTRKKMAITEYIRNADRAILNTVSITQFGVSINVWSLAGDSLNITCNSLCCNHQGHRDFLVTLYTGCFTSLWHNFRRSFPRSL
jgi:hypothetical protein